MLRDLTNEQLRAARPQKWSLDGPDVIPAWVAEMDIALPPSVHEAITEYVAGGIIGYAPSPETFGLPQSLADFARRQWNWPIDTGQITVVGTVMSAMRIVLEHLAEPGPVIVPTPVYPPFMATVRAMGADLRPVALREYSSGERSTYAFDLEAIQREIDQGATTLLLCHPHNPIGKTWNSQELAALRDVVEPAGVRVISDEIHAPLTHPGVDFVSYGAVASPEAPVSVLLAATKGFSMPGLPCAQIVSVNTSDHRRLQGLPGVVKHGVTSLGLIASETAYRTGDDFLAAVQSRIASNIADFDARLRAALPGVRTAAADATYLCWVDVRGLGLDEPVASALRAGVRIDGQDYGPGTSGHVRVNLGTSPERAQTIAERLIDAWSA